MEPPWLWPVSSAISVRLRRTPGSSRTTAVDVGAFSFEPSVGRTFTETTTTGATSAPSSGPDDCRPVWTIDNAVAHPRHPVAAAAWAQMLVLTRATATT